MPRLILTNGHEKRVVALADAPLTIGRDPDNAITIESPDVSRRHCRIEPDGPGHWRVVDLGSKNGTLLNGRPLTSPARLGPKDTITIGDASIAFSVEDEPPTAPLRSPKQPFLDSSKLLDRPKSGFWPDLFEPASTEDDDEPSSSTEGPLPPGIDRRTTRGFLKDQLLHLNFLSQAIASELDLDKLLDQILDAVLDFTRFERGLLLLFQEGGELKPVRARNLDHDHLAESERVFSRKVIETALRRKDVTLVKETGSQELERAGWDPKASWATLGLKSALCLPLVTPVRAPRTIRTPDDRRARSAPTRVIGALYLDSQAEVRPFDSKDRRLLRAVGHQAAIALQNARLHQQATTDPLTQLANRGFFEQLFGEELKRAAEENTPLSLLMLDLDKFKSVNDRYGHQVGDQVLRESAKRIRDAVRRDDIAGRYGGEEIAVVLPGADAEAAKNVAFKIRNALKQAPMSEARIPVTVSIGIAVFPEMGRDTTSLVKRADQALYQAKHSGRDRAEVWRGSLDRSGHRMDALAGIVSGDVARDQRNLRALLEAIEIARSPLEPMDYLSRTLDKVLELTRGERALLFLGDSTDAVELRAARIRGVTPGKLDDLRYSTTTVRSAVEDRRAICNLDAADGVWKKPGPSASIENLRLKTVMCVPLVRDDKLLGAVYVDDKAAAREFTQGDLSALEALGHQLAVTLAFDPRFARGSHRTTAVAPAFTDADAELGKLRVESSRLREENLRLREENTRLRETISKVMLPPSGDGDDESTERRIKKE